MLIVHDLGLENLPTLTLEVLSPMAGLAHVYGERIGVGEFERANWAWQLRCRLVIVSLYVFVVAADTISYDNSATEERYLPSSCWEAAGAECTDVQHVDSGVAYHDGIFGLIY